MENRDSILLALGELKGDVKSILANQTAQRADIDDLQKRVVGLEKWQQWVFGVAAGVSALVAYAVQFIKNGGIHSG